MTLDIIWAKWQHSQDLIERWVFDWIKTTNTDKWDEIILTDEAKIFLVPISQNKDIITSVLENKYQWEIISGAWIMSTNPNNWKSNNSNLHFLFWPNSNENLKVIFNWEENEYVKQILKNSKKRKINIIESSIENHDTSMAYTQALTHFMIFLRDMKNPEDNSNKNADTPKSTVMDMITYNPYFRGIFNKFISWVKIWDNLSQRYLDLVYDNMKSKEIQTFWTPNFYKTIERNKEDNFKVELKQIDFINQFKEDYLK